MLALATSLTPRTAAGIIESFWNQPLGGLFEVADNWDGPVPDATVTAVFDLDAAYAVQFWNGDAVSNRLIVRDGIVTFDLTTNVQGTDPRFYDAVNPSFILPSVVVADSATDEPTLTVRGGVLSSEYTIIGLVPGSAGTIDFEATGDLAPALVNQWHIHVGMQGSGALNVTGPAAASCTDAVLGSLESGFGEVTISGSGAVLDCTGLLTVGKAGQGTLLVVDDGEVNCTSAIVGQQPGADGQVTVTGIGSMLAIAGSLDVGLSSNGSISVVDGGAMLSEGFAAIGTFEQFPGDETGGTGAVTVAGPASTWIHDGDLYVGFQGIGTLDVLEGATVISSTGFAGAEFANQGVVTVDGPGSVWGIGDVLEVWRFLTVSDGALVIADSVNVLQGELGGDGTIVGAVINGAAVAPGDPLGTLTIEGNFTQDANQLLIELGGTVPGSFDALAVSQTAQIGGSLLVSLVDGFIPAAGDSFTIVSAGTLLGAFESVTLPELGPSLTWQTTQDGSELVLQAIGSGDLDGNGTVNIADFLSLLKSWGPCPSKGDCPADLDGDGEVGIADFLLLLAAWD
jgi:T5SS/PEP-CTERM-associated repeat protein